MENTQWKSADFDTEIRSRVKGKLYSKLCIIYINIETNLFVHRKATFIIIVGVFIWSLIQNPVLLNKKCRMPSAPLAYHIQTKLYKWTTIQPVLIFWTGVSILPHGSWLKNAECQERRHHISPRQLPEAKTTDLPGMWIWRTCVVDGTQTNKTYTLI